MEINNSAQQQIILQVANHLLNFSKIRTISIHEKQVEVIFDSGDRNYLELDGTKDFSSITPTILSYGKNATVGEFPSLILLVKLTPCASG